VTTEALINDIAKSFDNSIINIINIDIFSGTLYERFLYITPGISLVRTPKSLCAIHVDKPNRRNPCFVTKYIYLQLISIGGEIDLLIGFHKPEIWRNSSGDRKSLTTVFPDMML
jgi:hypothetical protein